MYRLEDNYFILNPLQVHFKQ